METIDLPERLTGEELAEYGAKAEELAKKYGVSKVHPVVQIDYSNGKKRYVCYLKEPNYITKVRLMDKAVTLGAYTAGEELRELCTLKEESDSITYSESPDSDKFKLGIVDYAMDMIERLQNQFKKK